MKELKKAIDKIQDGEDVGLVLCEYAGHCLEQQSKVALIDSTNDNVKHWLIGRMISHRFETGHDETMNIAIEIHQTLVDAKALTGRFEV